MCLMNILHRILLAVQLQILISNFILDIKQSWKAKNKSRKKTPIKALYNTETTNQATLEDFLLKSKENSNGTQTTLPLPKIKNNLEEQLKRKTLAIKALEQQNRMQAERVAKTRNVLIKKIRQLSDFKRKQNGAVKLLYGRFGDSPHKQFIYGPYITNMKQQISSLQKTMKSLKLPAQTVSSLSQFQALNKKFEGHQHKLDELQKQLKSRTIQVNRYISRLKLSMAEQSSIMRLENWPILNKRYVPQQLLGKGGFAQVYSCYDLERLQEVAIKIHKLDSFNDDQYTNCLKYIRRQININKQLSHPNIAKMYDQIQLQGNRIGIVMEYCSGPQLRAYFRERECLQQKQAKQFIKQILDAVRYLHQRNETVIHYDLKPANILLHEGKIKIVDFGISKIMSKCDASIQLTSPNIGTCYYLPPEVLLPRKPMINDKVDIWSIGIIFYELLYGTKPFGDGMTSLKFVESKIIKDSFKFSFPKVHPKGNQISKQVKNFIYNCLQWNIDKRITAEQAYNHPYFSS